MAKPENRMVPEETNPKFYAQELKPYELVKKDAAGKVILDVGCGDGYGPASLAKVASKVTGIDYEKDVITKAQSKYVAPNLKFLCMGATDLEFEDNTFDIA